MKIAYCGIEPYEARYTLQLLDWNKRVFDRRAINVIYVDGETLPNIQGIVTGQVLDAHGRTFFSLSQMQKVIKLLQDEALGKDDVIFFEDMYTSGFDALGYVLDQIPSHKKPRLFVRCLAQTIDPDDFLHVHGLESWMRYYEALVNDIVKKSGGAILATNEEMVAYMRVANWQADIYNISGLAFGKEEVSARAISKPWETRKKRVVFAARWDSEKQPDFYMDIVENYLDNHNDVEFCVVSGGPLRSNDQQLVDRAIRLENAGMLTIHQNLSKNEYYTILGDSRVLLNTALQDWVSNTVSEADTLGCNVLYPAYRSFPETFSNDPERLYIPWSIQDALSKLKVLLEYPHKNIGRISDWTDKTIDRICDIMEGKGEQWKRTKVKYRNYTRENKYPIL